MNEPFGAFPRGLPHPIGEAHFRLPDFGNATYSSIKDIYDWGGRIINQDGDSNSLFENCDHPIKIEFQLKGSSRNSIYVNNCNNLHGKIGITGSDNTIIICGNCPWPSRLNINMNGNRSFVFIGAGSTFVGTDLFPTGDDISVIFGEDCMFSHATMVRTYDQHTIFDLETKEWVNKPASVLIGPHIWAGQETLILKGSEIGSGSILGARSTVNSVIAPMSLCVGTPAKAIRSNVSWLRHSNPDSDAMNAVIGRYI